MPAESGPRSVIPTSMGTMNSPSRGRSDGAFQQQTNDSAHVDALLKHL